MLITAHFRNSILKYSYVLETVYSFLIDSTNSYKEGIKFGWNVISSYITNYAFHATYGMFQGEILQRK